jgi:hypothetical protein
VIPVHSSLYEGSVGHLRLTPERHGFRYPLYLAYLDLAELDEVQGTLPLRRLGRWAPVRFDRSDYLDGGSGDLATAVRDRVEQETGTRPDGPIRLLTQLRTFGWLFNPLSVYFCFDRRGQDVRYVVAEVTNTPWRERHAYVIEVDSIADDHWFSKALHVSPFMAMNQDYRLRLDEPSERFGVRLENHQDGSRVFVADLQLRRRPMSRREWWRMLRRYPLMTWKVSVGIYRQALALHRKRVPFVRHPSRATRPEGAVNSPAVDAVPARRRRRPTAA